MTPPHQALSVPANSVTKVSMALKDSNATEPQIMEAVDILTSAMTRMKELRGALLDKLYKARKA